MNVEVFKNNFFIRTLLKSDYMSLFLKKVARG